MAKSKKTSSKALKQKVRKIVEGDVFKSIAAASILLNVLFLVSIVVLTNSNSFDHHVFNAARSRYCENSEAVASRTKELGSAKAAQLERQVECVGKDYKPFYDESLKKFEAQSNQ